MLKAKRFLGLLMAVVLGLSIVGCDSSGNETTEKKDEKATSAESDGAQKAGGSSNYKIGFITLQMGHSVPLAWSKGIEKELKYFENVQYKAFDGEAKAETQVKLIHDLINQKYDCIILQAADGAALASSVKEAEEAGIPVLNLNLDVPITHAGLVQMVDYEAGQIVADNIAKAINNKGNVVILQSPPGATLGVNREKGFRDRIAQKYPDIKIVGAQNAEWMKDKAITVMNSFLQANNKIDAVYGINDSMAEGAALAAESAGRLKEMVIWGADGEKDALTMIEQGKMTGTIYTNCFDQGATAARLAMYILSSNVNLKEIKNTGVIKIAPIAVTKETVSSIAPEDRW